MRDALLDLLLGSSCAVCGRAGRVLCTWCRDALPGRAYDCWPSPTPAGLVRPTAVGEYDGPLRLLVNAHKEEHRFALARPLGDLLAVSLLAHVTDTGADATGADGTGTYRVLVVPVPSRARVVRRRGHDPLLRIALRAASRLRACGVQASVARLLRSVRATADQAGLGASERARNLTGSMSCSVGTRTSPGRPEGRLLVVDDVITTGATLREAQRALEDGGLVVRGLATVAATRRTTSGTVSSGPAGGADR